MRIDLNIYCRCGFEWGMRHNIKATVCKVGTQHWTFLKAQMNPSWAFIIQNYMKSEKMGMPHISQRHLLKVIKPKLNGYIVLYCQYTIYNPHSTNSVITHLSRVVTSTLGSRKRRNFSHPYTPSHMTVTRLKQRPGQVASWEIKDWVFWELDSYEGLKFRSSAASVFLKICLLWIVQLYGSAILFHRNTLF